MKRNEIKWSGVLLLTFTLTGLDGYGSPSIIEEAPKVGDWTNLKNGLSALGLHQPEDSDWTEAGGVTLEIKKTERLDCDDRGRKRDIDVIAFKDVKNNAEIKFETYVKTKDADWYVAREVACNSELSMRLMNDSAFVTLYYGPIITLVQGQALVACGLSSLNFVNGKNVCEAPSQPSNDFQEGHECPGGKPFNLSYAYLNGFNEPPDNLKDCYWGKTPAVKNCHVEDWFHQFNNYKMLFALKPEIKTVGQTDDGQTIIECKYGKGNVRSRFGAIANANLCLLPQPSCVLSAGAD